MSCGKCGKSASDLQINGCYKDNCPYDSSTSATSSGTCSRCGGTGEVLVPGSGWPDPWDRYEPCPSCTNKNYDSSRLWPQS